MGNIWRLLSDVTWPVVAYTTVSSIQRTTEPFVNCELYRRVTSSIEEFLRYVGGLDLTLTTTKAKVQGIRRPPHRGHVASVFLQLDQHLNVTDGHSRYRLRVEIRP